MTGNTEVLVIIEKNEALYLPMQLSEFQQMFAIAIETGEVQRCYVARNQLKE